MMALVFGSLFQFQVRKRVVVFIQVNVVDMVSVRDATVGRLPGINVQVSLTQFEVFATPVTLLSPVVFFPVKLLARADFVIPAYAPPLYAKYRNGTSR